MQSLLWNFAGRRSLYTSPAVVESAARIFKPSTRTLTAAEVAFANRLGMAEVEEKKFRSALAHPLLPRSKPLAGAFTKYRAVGTEVLELLVRDYVAARFSKLPKDSAELAVQIYTTNKNVAAAAKGVGLEYAIIEFGGIPLAKMPTLEQYIKSSTGEEAKEDKAPVRPSVIHAEIFQALVGLCFTQKGALETRKMLDAFLFSGTFNKDLLCRPRNPMIKLARALQHYGRHEPDYRLLHETGRLSNTSIYGVGVYSGLEKLAEAHGPSLLVAQERAAVEALRRLFVVDTPEAARKSDALLKEESPVISVADLRRILTEQ